MKRINSVSIATVLIVLICSQMSLALVVSNLNKTNYIVANNGLNVGAIEYVDRAYTFTVVPSAYQGKTYIQTANDDRGSTGDSFLTFDIDQESTVYVAHDNRLVDPSWLASFTPTGNYLTSSDSGNTFSLYGKVFQAGTVTLGGNYGDGTVSMYSVVIIPVPITTPPDPASNPTPANAATDISIETDLSWTAGAHTTSHDVYFGTTSPGDPQGLQSGTTFDPGVLANGTTYYWRIDEINAMGTTTGTVWSFTTESTGFAPDPASNPSPSNCATTNVSINTDLSWTAGAGATSHDVYFGTTSPGDFQINQAGTTFDPGTLALNTTYYWRIDEVNAYGTTTGTVWSFTAGGGIYIGGAFNMMDLGDANAAGWEEVRDYGAHLHVHPVGWRGQWEEIGAAVCPNFNSRNFLYEYDIVDPRNGVDNLGEIANVEAFNMTCEAAFCNFDGREMLNNRDQLVADFTNMVSLPLHEAGIFFYFTFSPVATSEIRERTAELLQDQYWISVANDCGADGIGLDFPPSYWSVTEYRNNLIQFIHDAKNNNLPVLFMASITTKEDIDYLAVTYAGLKAANALPDAWNMNQWHGSEYALTPEKNVDDSPAGTLTGAALWLSRNAFPVASRSGKIRIEAENFDAGGEGIAYHDATSINLGGEYCDEAVDIEKTSDTRGGYSVGWTETGEWLKYTLLVRDPGVYAVALRMARGSTNNGFVSIMFDGANLAPWSTVPPTGGWQEWTTINEHVTLAAGEQEMTVYFESGDTNINWIELTYLGPDFLSPKGVGLEDFAYLGKYWQRSDCSFENNESCYGADLDGSGVVDVDDFFIFVSYWLTSQ